MDKVSGSRMSGIDNTITILLGITPTRAPLFAGILLLLILLGGLTFNGINPQEIVELGLRGFVSLWLFSTSLFLAMYAIFSYFSHRQLIGDIAGSYRLRSNSYQDIVHDYMRGVRIDLAYGWDEDYNPLIGEYWEDMNGVAKRVLHDYLARVGTIHTHYGLRLQITRVIEGESENIVEFDIDALRWGPFWLKLKKV